jgi:hypothetical protein
MLLGRYCLLGLPEGFAHLLVPRLDEHSAGRYLLGPSDHFVTLLENRYGLFIKFGCQFRLVNLQVQTFEALQSGDESRL